MSILDKAKEAVKLCRTLLSNNPNKRYLAASSNNVTSSDDQKQQIVSKLEQYSQKENLQSTKKSNKQKNKKGRTRSYSDLTVSKSDIFEDEMSKIILDTFPEILQDEFAQQQQQQQQQKNGDDEQNQYEIQNQSVIKIFELYHRYYVEVHLPREMELRKVRTKCEQTYNSLRYVSNKKELARREEDEIDWVMMEMKRAIDRLNKEGVFTKEEEQNNKKKGKKGKKKKQQEKNNNNDDDVGDTNHYKPPSNVHRDSATMIPVLAHRSTWSEASDTIFQLNVARQQQYQATKDLEESLKSREVVKSWYEEKIAVE